MRRPASGVDVAEEHINRGRLARAIRTEKAEDLPARDGERQVFHGDERRGFGKRRAVLFTQVHDFNGKRVVGHDYLCSNLERSTVKRSTDAGRRLDGPFRRQATGEPFL